ALARPDAQAGLVGPAVAQPLAHHRQEGVLLGRRFRRSYIDPVTLMALACPGRGFSCPTWEGGSVTESTSTA
ncbi:hypothetical protein P9383_24985, partial [Escherichia coli]